MSKSDLSFKRKERKFIILEQSFDEIKVLLSKHIPIHTLNKNQENVLIQTTYFDSTDFLLFNEYLQKRKFRFKIRLRRYGYDGEFADHYLAELKIKHNSISIKKRFILPEHLFEKLLNGENIKDEIREANKELKGAQKTYKLVSKLIKINELVPILQISYERIAFQKKSKKIRMTIDRNISHKKLLGKPKTETLDAIIFESKINGKSPKWYKKMIKKLSLLRQQRFSKFATGMNALYFPQRGKYNFFIDDAFPKNKVPENIIESFELLKKAFNLEKFDYK
ncbi:MAG: polyphosphate polymerase domain-containing protein [Candidatus Cloacimonetes bacterium]|nr:polyphosphate polymerase domain-containing protein [Candidatus Cloacimonadota bacterium]